MKKLLTILFSFILINFSFAIHAQVDLTDSLRIDSLKKVLQRQKDDTNKVNTLNELSYSYRQKDAYENAMKSVSDALLLAEKLNFKKGQSNAYIEKALLSSSVDEMLNYLNLSIQFAKESKDTSLIYGSYYLKGDMCRSNEKYAEALQSYLEALKIAELRRNKYDMASAYQKIAGVYLGLGNNADVLKNSGQALKLFAESGSFEDVGICDLVIGVCYYNMGDYNKALYNLNQGLISIEKAGPPSGSGFSPDDIKGFLLLNMGRSQEMLGIVEKNENNRNNDNDIEYYNEAEQNYMAARVLGEKGSNPSLLPQVFINLGSLYLKKKNIKDSRIYLDKAFQLFRQNGSKDGLKECYLKLSIYDSTIGNYKKAYEDYKLYMRYFREIQSDSSIQKTSQLQDQYEFDKKETIARAEQQKKDADTKRIKNQQFFTIIALGIIVLAVIIIALIQLKNNKQKQKANNLLQQQKEKVESTLIELKSTQSQLIQSEKMASLGELTAGIAHEIQNPLNFVNNFSEVNTELIDELKTELATGNVQQAIEIADNLKDNEEKIVSHGKRADAIVKGMLQHSRSSSGVKEQTEINALADEYLRLAYHGQRAKDKEFNATIKTDYDEAIGKINITPQDIGRVILNLITNAFYAVTEKKKTASDAYEPTVTVSTKRIGDPSGDGGSKIEIRVKDNGNGIPQRVLDKIFQPFFTTKPTGQGTGLGLSLAYDIIKAHGGEIKVETKEGEGSEFIIQLPTV